MNAKKTGGNRSSHSAEVAFKLVIDKKRSGILLPEVLKTEYESDSVVVKENESESPPDTDEILNKPIAVE